MRHGDLSVLPVAVTLAIIWIVFYALDSVFISPRNLSFLFLQIAVIGTIALGVTFVLLIGEIDLSVAVTSGVSAAAVGVLVTRQGWDPIPAILLALAIGAAVGVVQGFFVAVVGVPSFVVTLAGLLGLQGVMLLILGRGGSVNVGNELIRSIATTYLAPGIAWVLAAGVVVVFVATQIHRRAKRLAAQLSAPSLTGLAVRVVLIAALVGVAVSILNEYRGVPLASAILVGFVALFGYVTRRMQFGRYLYAIGGNAEASRRAGIDVAKVRIAAFTLSSLLCAVAGVIGAARFASVSYTAFAGGPLLLESIAAAVIGGATIFGGRGSPWGALLGALVMGSLSNGLDLMQASTGTKLAISGVILLIAVTADALSQRGRGDIGVKG
ncbi:ABC transporter permease [Actinobacteria bacterium YIM 96077]|uniref:Xylose transport system permease protein XylH n=1 Tax=Phytoactinopolyspora halophila TaxID=1981511 RepID=A0A329R0N8_9ACTN|nr:ABC transporter permease [Actinobacteria bacterium YIM 96077]RAW18161.1 ABC transporter permease [Phytoactinopolyspora halophila]